MTPTFSDFFKSFYYSNTYVSPVDLSEQGIAKHLLASEDSETANQVQQLISDSEVQRVFSEPLSYDPEKIEENNEILTQRGFKLLSSKPILGSGVPQKIPFYSVIEHDQLDGWIIKSGATRVPKDQVLMGPMNDKNEMAFFTEEESILRIEMAKRIAKVAKESSIEVVLPKKKLVAYANMDGVTEANRKYCVVCEKINILSVEETVQTIKNMNAEAQKEVARKIATIVQKAGLVDASFDNIRLTPEGKLAFIDTEPAGLMVAKKPGLWNKLFGPKGASVEKCARIGLFTLMAQATKVMRGTAKNNFDAQMTETGLENFHQQIKKDYENISTPKLSKWKIALSFISIGLIPLINAVVALAKTKFTKRTFEKLQKMDSIQTSKVNEYLQDKVPEAFRFDLNFASEQEQLEVRQKVQKANKDLQKEKFFEDYKKQRAPIAKQFFAYTEGVPYTFVMV